MLTLKYITNILLVYVFIKSTQRPDFKTYPNMYDIKTRLNCFITHTKHPNTKQPCFKTQLIIYRFDRQSINVAYLCTHVCSVEWLLAHMYAHHTRACTYGKMKGIIFVRLSPIQVNTNSSRTFHLNISIPEYVYTYVHTTYILPLSNDPGFAFSHS
jgi:hypothetical protein